MLMRVDLLCTLVHCDYRSDFLSERENNIKIIISSEAASALFGEETLGDLKQF